MKKIIYFTLFFAIIIFSVKEKRILEKNDSVGLFGIKKEAPANNLEKKNKKEEVFVVENKENEKIVKDKVLSYFEYTKDLNKDEIRATLFDELYNNPQQHKLLMGLFSDLNELKKNYGKDQSKFRVFAVDYFSYIAKKYHDYTSIESMVLVVQNEIEHLGDQKSRSIDLEDLVIGFIEAKKKIGLSKEEEFSELIRRLRPSVSSYDGYARSATYLFPHRRLDKKWANEFYEKFKG